MSATKTANEPAVTQGGGIDPANVAAFCVEHGAELRRFVVGVLRDREAANDVLQTVFARAIEQCQTVDTASLKGWLFTVALHEALAQRRRLEVMQKAHLKLWWQPARHGETPEESLTRVETVAEVRKALAALPTEQAGVVRARIYDDKTFAQIARETGLPLGTVLTRMRLALEKLRGRLSGNE